MFKKTTQLEKIILKTKKVFIHIPKTGGISVFLSLYGILGDHKSISDWQKIISKRQYNTLYKFSVIREPIDRFISAYNFYLNSGLGTKNDTEIKNLLIDKYKNINLFVDNLTTGKENILLFVPQFKFLSNLNNEIDIDNLIPFTNLEKGINEIAHKKFNIDEFSLMRINQAHKKLYSVNDLTESSIEKLSLFYREDFKLLEQSVTDFN